VFSFSINKLNAFLKAVASLENKFPLQEVKAINHNNKGFKNFGNCIIFTDNIKLQ
jgi:hypothetical protein